MMEKKNEAAGTSGFFRSTSLFLLFLLSAGCYLYRLERKLDSENAEFLNRVRYIITSKEERIFLQLPESDRAAFRNKFWLDRDPDPETEVNEFKQEYFRRMEQADELFLTEGIAGWRTDRGRMLILYGLPGERLMSRGGAGIHRNCAEIWYYGDFPVAFLDLDCTGYFLLATFDLSPLLAYSLENQVLGILEEGTAGRKALDSRTLSCGVELRNVRFQPEKLDFVIALSVPFTQVWFRETGGKLETLLEIRLRLLDEKNRELWSFTDAIRLETDEALLQADTTPVFQGNFPAAAAIPPGTSGKARYRVFLELTNQTGGAVFRKMVPLKP